MNSLFPSVRLDRTVAISFIAMTTHSEPMTTSVVNIFICVVLAMVTCPMCPLVPFLKKAMSKYLRILHMHAELPYTCIKTGQNYNIITINPIASYFINYYSSSSQSRNKSSSELLTGGQNGCKEHCALQRLWPARLRERVSLARSILLCV